MGIIFFQTISKFPMRRYYLDWLLFWKPNNSDEPIWRKVGTSPRCSGSSNNLNLQRSRYLRLKLDIDKLKYEQAHGARSLGKFPKYRNKKKIRKTIFFALKECEILSTENNFEPIWRKVEKPHYFAFLRR